MEHLLKAIRNPELYSIIDGVPFGDSKEFQQMRARFPNLDPGFLWLLAFNREGMLAKRAYIDAAYLQYRQVLDKQFAIEFPKDRKFTSRLWEMLLCDVFSASGKLSSRSSKGPDFILTGNNNERIRVEAVAPDESDDESLRSVRPDFSTSNTFSHGGNIEELEYPVLMRVYNKGLLEKANRKGYAKGEPLIIAINSSKVVGLISSDEYVLRRLLFGLGYVTLTRMSDGTTRTGFQLSESLKASDGSKLPVGLFRDSEYDHVSGVIYSSKNPLSLLPGADGWSAESVVYVPNPRATCPLTTKFPFFKTITCTEEKYEETPAEKKFSSSVNH